MQSKIGFTCSKCGNSYEVSINSSKPEYQVEYCPGCGKPIPNPVYYTDYGSKMYIKTDANQVVQLW